MVDVSPMLTVTDSAREELKRTLETRSLDPGQCLRLAVPPVWSGEGDFGIVIDEQGQGDYAVELEGAKVLLVDPAVAEQLSSSVLDFKDSPDGPRFTLDVY